MDAYLAPLFGSLVLLALGVLISLLREISGKLTLQGEKLVQIATVVGIDGNGLVEDVRELQLWRDQVRSDELDLLRSAREPGRPS